MAYTKQNWQTGETITAEKLNHMEDGIKNASDSGGSYEIKVLNKGDYSTSPSSSKKIIGFSIDKTNGNEIRDAFLNGQEVFLLMDVYDNGKNLYKFILLNIMPENSGSTAFQFACLSGRYYSYIDLSFSAYPPTYSFIKAYAATKDLWATS